MANENSPANSDENRANYTKLPSDNAVAPTQTGTASNLLYGLLALQLNYVDQIALISVIRAWIADRSRPIREILQSRGGVSDARLQLLDRFYEDYLAGQKGDAQQGIAELTKTKSVLPDLIKINDNEVTESVSKLGETQPFTGSSDPEFKVQPSSEELITLTIAYQLVSRAGTGGLGEVSTAIENNLSRMVVLKTINERYRNISDYQARFRLEAEVCGRLEHPGVVPVHCLGVSASGVTYFAMRYIPEGDLRARLKAYHEPSHQTAGDRSVAFRGLLSTFVQVCNATAYAHSRGVIHRDIKPANILVGDYGETFLADWGLAKVIGREDQPEGSVVEPTLRPSGGSSTAPSYAGQAMGTTEYMSPEQANGEPHNHGFHTDIFLLGSTLYTILVGHPPFQGPKETKEENARKCRFKSPREVNPAIPPALEAICLQAMAVDPQDRYASAKTIATEVNLFLADEPVSVYRDPLSKRATRWVRRHKQLVSAASVLFLTGVIGLIVGTILLNQEKQKTELARDEARRARDVASGSYKIALNTSNQLYNKTAFELARISGFEPTRLIMSEIFTNSYEKLLNLNPDDDSLRLTAVRANREAANLGRLTGELSKSPGRYRRALQLIDELVGRFPENHDYQVLRAFIEIDLGSLLEVQGDYSGAEVRYQSAIKSMEPYRKKEPTNYNFAGVEGWGTIAMADLLHDQGKGEASRIMVRKALRILRDAKGSDLSDDQHANCIISAILIDGMSSRMLGDLDTAIKCFDEVLAIARSKPYESDPNFGFPIALALYERGTCFELRAGAIDQARLDFQPALDDLTRLVQASPANRIYRQTKASVANHLGGVMLKAGELDQAEKQEGIAINEIDLLLKSYDLIPLHSIKGEILANQARIAAARKLNSSARTLFDMSLAQHTRAWKSQPDRKIDRAAIQVITAERARLPE